MSDYTKTTNFTAKDSLPSGNAAKLIKGSDFDTEFDALAVAVATKYDSNDLASLAQAEAAINSSANNTAIITPLRLWNWASDNAGVVEEAQTLTDPGADRILFWDDGEAAGSNVAWLTVGAGLEISTSTLQLPSTVAGDGLTLTSGVLAVVGTAPIVDTADAVTFDMSGLTSITSASIVGADLFLIDDGGGGTNKTVAYQDFGIPVSEGGDFDTATPFANADLTYANRLFKCNFATAITATIPANASVAYPVGTTFLFWQEGAGQITVAVTSDTLRSPNGAKTATQYSMIQVTKVASTEWVVTGDSAA